MKKMETQRLFKLYYAKMYRVARTILFDEQESKDVVSDVFESLLNDGMALMPETAEHYLLTSVRNRCIKRIRHDEVRRQVENHSLDVLAYEETEDERLTDIVEYVVSHLSPQEQRIFNLRFAEGCSYDEIAATEGISRVAVWKHLSHVLNVIKNHFNK
ncbi:MAG: sigma-70 family RNA polymerase sigma factor [Bacteroidaceae bacterium]|nr:sigma-70 family RNA polymerase sigma factor [Bacteroidaceae bacterium]MBR5962911.1 sigma-70 family RNA polymerase sigma factor [Bacteroidaceae bacterium]